MNRQRFIEQGTGGSVCLQPREGPPLEGRRKKEEKCTRAVFRVSGERHVRPGGSGLARVP